MFYPKPYWLLALALSACGPVDPVGPVGPGNPADKPATHTPSKHSAFTQALTPSLQLASMRRQPPANKAVHIDVMAYQWHWGYSYKGYPNSDYLSQWAPDEKRTLLGVDKALYVPVNTTINLHISSDDVIHAFWVPSLYERRIHAVPGYTNFMSFTATKKGRHIGVCAELCGRNHGYMPIIVNVVDRPTFDAWVAARQAEHPNSQ